MARTIQVILTDDIDGSADAQSVSFAFQGVEYTIDLSAKNLDKLSGALAPFIDKAERVGRRRKTKAVAPKINTNVVRTWARANGHEVSDRGRIPADIMAAYEAAHKA